MHGKRIAIVLAAAADVILAVCLISASRDGEAEAAFSGRISVTGITENSGTDKLTLDMQTPVVSGLGDKGFERDLNGKIKTQIDSARAAAEKAADEFWRQTEKEGFEPWPYIFYAEYEVKSAGAILSLKVTTFLYTGGPGMPQTIYYNADTEKNKLIALSGLFNSKGYKHVINSIILEAMAKDIERYVPPEEFPGVSRNTKFFISEGKLYIAFAKYEVASGMTGEPEFLIPTEAIRSLLKDEYSGILK